MECRHSFTAKRSRTLRGALLFLAALVLGNPRAQTTYIVEFFNGGDRFVEASDCTSVRIDLQ